MTAMARNTIAGTPDRHGLGSYKLPISCRSGL